MAGYTGKYQTMYTGAPKKVDYSSMGKSLQKDVIASHKGESGAPDITPNPYTFQVGQQIESGAIKNPYAGHNQALASKLMGLGNTDFSGDINRMSQEGITKEKTAADAKYGALGMSEMSLREDVQDQWASRRTDAATKARITGAELKRSALATAVQGIQSMSGTDLDYAMSKIGALLSAGGQWQNYQSMMIPLMEKMGQGGAEAPTSMGGRSLGGGRRG